ncbi:hypothetical protein U472_13505 [Orenia metallireducens]|uniref:ABC transport system permease protein n=1 Tax=Orenia metallireducens TaxID=1413210 RepID=A0A1C0A5F0_9FIRM|nr:ABC transporter permease [Orenia metallireducens]OCL25362.1 hypothetical protein U472_13505 [Orenia metallireducens]
MGILLKFTLRNIKEKKFRTFLILFSIALSAALFFASLAISSTVEQMQIERLKKYFGTAEIIIYANSDSPSSFFRTYQAEQLKEQFEYIVGTMDMSTSYKYSEHQKVDIHLQGYELDDLQKMNPIILEEKVKLEPFVGNKLIIGRVDADKYGLELGDKVDLEVDGEKYRFIVSAIAVSQGLFEPGSRNIRAVVPKKKLATLYDARGRVSRIYLKTKEGIEVKEAIKSLSEKYHRYTVRKTVTRAEIKEYSKSTTAPFMMMLPIVIFISIFIIYTSFKVITMERLPMIGTFRSIGATRKITDLLLLVESFMYGVIGGIFGCGIGFGILYGMTNILAKNPWSRTEMKAEMVFTSGQLLTAFLTAVIISVLSSLIPIIKVSKIPVKDIILNNIDNKSKRRRWKPILGLLLLIASLIIPRFVSDSQAMIINIICMLTIGAAIIMLIPIITNLFIIIFEHLYSYIFGNEGILAVKNLRDNKSIINNISLLTIGIASLLMINTLSHSVAIEVSDVYGDAKFDIWMWHPRADRNLEQRLLTVDGVRDVYSAYQARNVKIVEKEHSISEVTGIDVEEYFDYWDYDIIGDRRELFKEMEEGRKIILTTMLKEKLNIDYGQILTLETKRGKKKYRVAGFINTLMENGDMALVGGSYLKRDMDLQYRDQIYLRTSKDPEKVKEAIKDKFARDRLWLDTLKSMEKRNMESNNQLFIILKGFSFIAMIIGVFGIFNNFVVSFISRKRSLAVFRSIGMSKRQIIKMILIETMTGGLIGGLVGVFGGVMFIEIIKFVLKAMTIPIKMHYSISMFITAVVAGSVISVIASISPALRSSKLNIIEAIKYE